MSSQYNAGAVTTPADSFTGAQWGDFLLGIRRGRGTCPLTVLRITKSTLVAPGGPARLVRLEQAPTRRPTGAGSCTAIGSARAPWPTASATSMYCDVSDDLDFREWKNHAAPAGKEFRLALQDALLEMPR